RGMRNSASSASTAYGRRTSAPRTTSISCIMKWCRCHKQTGRISSAPPYGSCAGVTPPTISGNALGAPDDESTRCAVLAGVGFARAATPKLMFDHGLPSGIVRRSPLSETEFCHGRELENPPIQVFDPENQGSRRRDLDCPCRCRGLRGSGGGAAREPA